MSSRILTMMRSVSVMVMLCAFLSITAHAQYVLEPVTEGGSRLHFISAAEGFAFGPSRILRTVDSGATWETVTANIQTAIACDGISSGSFVNSTTGWVVGYQLQTTDNAKTFIYRTTDGGATWTKQRSAPEPSAQWLGHPYSAIHFSDVNNGVVVGKGIIERTTDGGATWSAPVKLKEQPANNDWFGNVFFLNKNVGWVVGYGSFILHTSDGGATWSTQHVDSATYNGAIVNKDFYYLYSIHFADAMNGVAAANNGHYLYTSDGGATWLPKSTGAVNDNIGIYMITDKLLWQVGGNYCDDRGCFIGRSLLYSTNGGVSWDALADPELGPNEMGPQYRDVRFITPRLGFVTNDDGRIFRIRDTSAILSSVDDNESGEYHVAIYPNPTRDLLTIDAGGKAGSIGIFDMMGRSVHTEPLAPGQAASVRTSELPEGSYVVEVRIGERRVREKIVVMR